MPSEAGAAAAAATDTGDKGAADAAAAAAAAAADKGAADKAAADKAAATDHLGGKGNGAEAADDAAVAEAEEGTNEAWWQNFSDGLDKSEAMSWRNMASRYKEPQAFARAHIELNKNAVFLPKDDDKDKDAKIGKVYERLGWPKEAKAYQFDDPKDLALDDTDKEYRESFRGIAHRLHLNQRQVKGLQDWQYEQAKLLRDSHKAAAEHGPEKLRANLRPRWGNQFDNNLGLANMAFRHYAGSKAVDLAKTRLADGTLLKDNPDFVDMLARVGKDRAEDETVITEMNRGQSETAMAQIQKLRDEATQKGLDPTSKAWPHEQLDRLYKKAYGTRSIRQDGAG